MTDQQPQRSSLAAWAVHLFTASGVVFALLGLAAAIADDQRAALAWLAVAILIDGVDGTLARKVGVKERLPRIDGDALDLIIDYLTFVFIPALIIWRGGFLPAPLALPLTAAILLSSLYTFARRDMKTDDGYFRGFPALWIIVAFYFVFVPVGTGAATGVVLALVALTFAPILVIHPFRARDFGIWPVAVTALGAAATLALLLGRWTGAAESALKGTTILAAAILFAMGLVRTVRGPKAQ